MASNNFTSSQELFVIMASQPNSCTSTGLECGPAQHQNMMAGIDIRQ